MRIIRGTFIIATVLSITLSGSFAIAEDSLTDVTNQVKIVEIQTTGKEGETDQEFVEIFNNSLSTIDITDWELQYSSSSGTTWQTKAIFDGYIFSKGRILLSSTEYLVSESKGFFTAGFKKESGHVRIVRDNEGMDEVVDLVGWGLAAKPEGVSVSFAPDGMTINRLLVDDTYKDTNNNLADFELASPTPSSLNIDNVAENEEVSISEEPHDTVTETVEEENDVVSVAESTENYLPVQITELLPNPRSPQTDDDDEYIEIYNPNDVVVNLDGYILETGTNFTYSYILEDELINPNSYLVLYSSKTNLVLSNSSSAARILDPNAVILFTTDGYESAKEGEAWANIDGVWQWTITSTPGIENVLSVQTVVAGAKKTVTPKATKKQTTKKQTTAKKKAAKAKTAKSKKQNSSSDNSSPAAVGSTDDDTTGFTPKQWMIGVIVTLAVGYLLYEYKDDIRNKVLQYRRNSGLREKTGKAT